MTARLIVSRVSANCKRALNCSLAHDQLTIVGSPFRRSSESLNVGFAQDLLSTCFPLKIPCFFFGPPLVRRVRKIYDGRKAPSADPEGQNDAPKWAACDWLWRTKPDGHMTVPTLKSFEKTPRPFFTIHLHLHRPSPPSAASFPTFLYNLPPTSSY